MKFNFLVSEISKVENWTVKTIEAQTEEEAREILNSLELELGNQIILSSKTTFKLLQSIQNGL